jgi:hypothetical protein
MSRRDMRAVDDPQPTFMDLLLAGDALQEQIDDFVQAWHDAKPGTASASQSLEVFLGMNWDEYRLWAEHPESLRFVAAARRANQPVDTLLRELDNTGVAARTGGQKEARRLLEWLIARGRVAESTATITTSS